MKEELELKENLILITRSGTIGKTVLVPKHWENWVASEDVLRIAPASAEMAGYESANEVYKYAYEVLCAPLKKLK